MLEAASQWMVAGRPAVVRVRFRGVPALAGSADATAPCATTIHPRAQEIALAVLAAHDGLKPPSTPEQALPAYVRKIMSATVPGSPGWRLSPIALSSILSCPVD
jgi:hypothetical protein